MGDRSTDCNMQIETDPSQLTFTPDNWDTPQTVTVTAIDDNTEEGRIWYEYASQPSFLSFIEGPLYIGAYDEATVPSNVPPLMIEGETNAGTFVRPGGTVFDDSFMYVVEHAVNDVLEVHDRNTRGTEFSIGEFTDYTLTGFNMAADVEVDGKPTQDGIEYHDFEVVYTYFGDGYDRLTIVNTTNARHFHHLYDGKDELYILGLGEDSL